MKWNAAVLAPIIALTLACDKTLPTEGRPYVRREMALVTDIFSSQNTFLSAWAQPTTVIDFGTRDDGSPLMDPATNVFLSPLTLRNVKFLNGRTYWNLYYYTGPNGVLRAELPAGTHAVGLELYCFYCNQTGEFRLTLSTGASYTVPYVAGTSSNPQFFGVISSSALGWIEITFNNDLFLIDNFTYGTLPNGSPVANPGGPYSVLENQPVFFTAAASNDPDGDALTYAWDFGDGNTGTGAVPAHTYADNGKYAVTLVVTDSKGASSAPLTTSAFIENVAPSISDVTLTASPVAVGSTVTLSASFSDPSLVDTHNAAVDWDDGSGPTYAEVDQTSGAITASRTFHSPGVYLAQLTVTDDDGGSVNATAPTYIVVYDPSSGFVTGGGSIESPAGAYAAYPALVGKATFGFVSKYQKGATTPSGKTEFQFHAGSLDFSSDAYQWLVVAGAKAQFKGTGKVNGQSGYGFLLTATDGQRPGGNGVDAFRIKIWSLATAEVLYDNVVGTADDIDSANPQALGSGSITIHTK